MQATDIINENSKSAELQSILDGITDPIILIDTGFRIKRLNLSALEFMHSKRFSEIVGHKCFEMIYGRTAVCPYCPFIKSKSNTFNNVFKGKNRHSRFHRDIYQNLEDYKKQILSLEFFPVENSGTIYSFVEKITNITRIREDEEEELRIRNLASLGILVSGVAHELNNPLTGMSLTLQNLKNNITTFDPVFFSNRIELIQKDLSKAAMIVKDIINFAKPDKLKATMNNLSEVIHYSMDTVTRIYPALCKQIQWEIKCDEQMVFLFNPVKMERLFLNLFKNALQEFNYSKGKISIKVREKKDTIVVTVEDNAGGIPESIINKIFDPFFTRNKTDSGTGLGLSICYAIVKDHGGTIKVESPGRKTIFTINLPNNKATG